MKAGYFIAFASFPLATLDLSAQVADAGTDQYICGDTTFLQGNLPGVGQSGSWSVFAGTGVFADATLATTQVTGLTFGDIELVWTLTDGMTTTTDTVLVVAYDPGALPAYAMGDTTLFGPPFNAMLIANSPYYPQSCTWTVVAGTASITEPWQSTTSVVGLNAGGNTFQWACENGPCGITTWPVTIYMWFSTGVLQHDAQLPFRVDHSSGLLTIVSLKPVRGLRIIDAHGRDVNVGSPLPNGVFVAQATIGDHLHTLRFVVSR